ncbi:hypothetical protein EDB19DRAFT_1742283 [Suillus lakei]|nr:hypothetical protein EDB19DRAFT_1742283 [Suillus lakei]
MKELIGIVPERNDPDTYTSTLELLNHTVFLLDSTPDHMNTVPASVCANYTRCISGVYHNLAGTL